MSIALIHDGEVSFFGIKRVNDTIITLVNHEQVFEIASISKVFTATLLSNFIEEGKLNLDDAIQDYDTLSNLDQKITFKSLANHTSGLSRLPSNLNLFTADMWNPYKDYGEDQLQEFLKSEIKLSQEPGLKYDYSNLGVGLLGYEISKIAKSTYEDLLQDKIFSKYDMDRSSTIKKKIETLLIPGLNVIGGETSNWDFNALVACGGILSTTNDLAKFAIAHFDDRNKELQHTQKSTFKVSKNMSIGLGWHILSREDKPTVIWHNGGTGGYSSSMTLDRANKNGVIILSNASAFNPLSANIDKLGFAVMETFRE